MCMNVCVSVCAMYAWAQIQMSPVDLLRKQFSQYDKISKVAAAMEKSPNRLYR